jgi:hypothetical protein
MMASKALLIRGTVRDPSGRPVADARVWIGRAPSPVPDIAALSGPDGEFAMSVSGEGEYELHCTADGFEVSREKVDVRRQLDSASEIVLEPS